MGMIVQSISIIELTRSDLYLSLESIGTFHYKKLLHNLNY
jgi:hypothetical protein